MNDVVFKVLIIPSTKDSWKTTTSPSINLKLFLGRYLKLLEFLTSPNTATAPLVWPTNNSPIIMSPVVAVGPLSWAKVISGDPKLASVKDTSDVSYIPWISIISAVFKEIILSWTLVPNA